MKYKVLFFVLSLAAIAAFLGCHAGGSAPFINIPSESEIYSKDYDVLENGRFADIYLPSGAVIRCTADHTLKPGTKVTATEQKVANEANSNEGISSYIYTLTGKLYSGDALNTAVAVNSLEKPISVTIPNNSETGLCYLGTRVSDNDTWRYTLAQDENQANTRFLRLSQTTQKNPTFNLYRLGIQFALFVFKNESREEAQIDSVVATPDKEVETKEGKYTGALTVKLNVEGENLNNIDPANLVAKIIYRSENKDGANINFATNRTDSEDNAVSGTYEHTFEITKIDKTSIGNTAELTFVIELDGVSIEDFPKDFIVELYSKSDDKNTLPFSYTQEFGFETKEKQDDPEPQPDPDPQPEPEPEPDPDNPTVTEYKISYDLDGGQLAKDNPKTYSVETEDITLNNPTKDGYTFAGWTGTDLDNPTTKVTIEKGSTGDRSYKANWQQNAPDEYTLTLVAGTGIASVDENKAYKAGEKITLNYTLKDGYEFDKWSDSEGNAVTSPFTMPAKAVTLTANAKVITYNLEYFLDGGYFETDNPKTYTVETENFDLNDPKKDGYAFLGWTSSETTAPLTPVSIKKGSTGDKKFIANWSINSYNLTINKGTGINTVTGAGMHEYNSSVTASCTMLAGYEFDKWSGDFTTETFTMPAKAVTLTANAKVITYNISYQNTDGATFATANPENYTVETESFTLNNPTKDDYIFLGWTYEGQTTPQLEVTITKGSTTGDKTYTANWEAKIIPSLKSAATDFAVDGQIQIEFDKEITWQDSYKSKITVTPTGTTTPTTPITTITINTYSYSNKVLTLTSASNLKYNTGYTVAIAGIEKISDKNLTFTTVDLVVTPVITSDSTNSPTELNGKFMLQPTFTIDFGKAVINQNSATSSVKLNGNALPDSAAFAFDTDGKIATLTFSSNLSVNTAYQLSITSFADDDNSTIKAVSGISFNTIETDRIGEGTESSPFLIFTASDLKGCGGNYYFKQMKDIVLPNEDWTPLGGYSVKYDGNHHKIIGLRIINNDNANYVGLFSSLDNSAIVQNLTIENVDIKGNMHIGGLAGNGVNFTIENVHISGNISIKGTHQVGGLVGVICENGNVTITKSSVSSENGIIEGERLIGGLVGNFQYNSSAPHDLNNIISESYVKIKLKCEYAVGGLVGEMEDCEVKNCYSDSTITIVEGRSSGIGGLIGCMDDDSKVTNSYSRGNIVIQSDSANSIGGLIGTLMDYEGFNGNFGNFGEVKNNFTSMSISGANFGNCPLYCDYGYVYEDTTNKNYFSDGYPASGLTWTTDQTSAGVWSGLTTGAYPTLINNPPPAQP